MSEPDRFDRARWENRLTVQERAIAKLCNEYDDQYKIICELRNRIVLLEEHDRENELKLGELLAKHEKLIEQLKVRFAELKKPQENP